jgi:hypothetical protein
MYIHEIVMIIGAFNHDLSAWRVLVVSSPLESTWVVRLRRFWREKMMIDEN